MLNTLIIRGAAGGILIVGGALFAADSGWLGGPGNAQTEAVAQDGEQTLWSDSRAVPHSLSPDLPEIVTSSDVRLPQSVAPLAAQAMIVPASFDLAPEVPTTISPTEEVIESVSDLGLPCGITFTVSAMPAAMVALDVMAPCRTEAAVRINHSGMNFNAETDTLGLLTLDVPAFESPAYFSVTFEDGTEETALVTLPDLADFDRIGLSWQGDMGLELHAMEFGAGFGEAGHVWHEAPADVAAAITGAGGYLTTLASDESFAQIYTLPRATLREGESVRLSIDAPVTATNCAQSVLARTLRAEAGGPVDVTELSFTVPGCDAVGDVLVLQNLLDDLRLASN